jgi:hypothetical protein
MAWTTFIGKVVEDPDHTLYNAHPNVSPDAQFAAAFDEVTNALAEAGGKVEFTAAGGMFGKPEPTIWLSTKTDGWLRITRKGEFEFGVPAA